MSLMCGVIRRAQVVDPLAWKRSSFSMQTFCCALHDSCFFLFVLSVGVFWLNGGGGGGRL